MKMSKSGHLIKVMIPGQYLKNEVLLRKYVSGGRMIVTEKGKGKANRRQRCSRTVASVEESDNVCCCLLQLLMNKKLFVLIRVHTEKLL